MSFHDCITLEQLKTRYHELAKRYHPDHGGTNEQMRKLKDAYELAKKEIESTFTSNGSSRFWDQEFYSTNDVRFNQLHRKHQLLYEEFKRLGILNAALDAKVAFLAEKELQHIQYINNVKKTYEQSWLFRFACWVCDLMVEEM